MSNADTLTASEESQSPDRDFRSRGWRDISIDSALRTHCYLCGATGTVEKRLQIEHVIPKVVFKHFRSTKPWRYVELWACHHCNQTVKKRTDDFAVRFIQVCSVTPNALAGANDALRGFEKGHGLDVLKRFMPLLKAPGASAVHAPTTELDKFFLTIAKGLWSRHSDRIFKWSNYNVRIRFDQASSTTKETLEGLIELTEKHAAFAGDWEDTFLYTGVMPSTEASVWTMMMYNTFVAVVMFERTSRNGVPFRSIKSISGQKVRLKNAA